MKNSQFVLLYLHGQKTYPPIVAQKPNVIDNGNIVTDGLTMEVLEVEQLLTEQGLEKTLKTTIRL
jgi:hypothetical protein